LENKFAADWKKSQADEAAFKKKAGEIKANADKKKKDMDAEKDSKKKAALKKEYYALLFEQKAATAAEGVAKALAAKMKGENDKKVLAAAAAVKAGKAALKGKMETA